MEPRGAAEGWGRILPSHAFLTRRDGNIVSDRVSLHAFTQHLFAPRPAAVARLSHKH